MGPAVQPARKTSRSHESCDLVQLFDRALGRRYRTRLIGGAEEPEYLPADASMPFARIFFTRDYFASALHEVAHWCVAGPERRRQYDYGYWYAPDGRTPAQQAEFERVEVKPQALEWIFSEASAFTFRVSADNLSQGLGPSVAFKRAVAGRARQYLEQGLPHRAHLFAMALKAFYGGSLAPELFNLNRLGVVETCE